MNNFIDYRKNVMDPISDTFCAAKWYNASIWLHTGMTASCHLPPALPIPLEELAKNPAAIHNTTHKMKMRELMLTDKRPAECDYCWKVEDIKRDNVSDRIFKTIIYKKEDIDLIPTFEPNKMVNLKTLELVFDNTCNLACSYCSSDFSTTWIKDIKTHGPYINLTCKEAGTYSNVGANVEKYKINNPFIKAFWEWWPELSQSLEELRITGGEPLMSDEVWKLLSMFSEKNINTRLAINSNLMAKRPLLKRLVEDSMNINDLVLYTSIEAVGNQAEYIRDGLIFEEWVDNVHFILSNAKLSTFNVMMTINSLCLFTLCDALDFCMNLKRKYGKWKGLFSINILRFPAFMSLTILPENIKSNQKQKLQDWLDKNKNDPMLHDFEKSSLQRLIDYLDVVKAPLNQTMEGINLFADFKSFYTQYDIRRNKDINIFPDIFLEWYKSL